MNQHHQAILNLIQQSDSLTAEQKETIAKSIKNADKELEITAFKLDRTEKVKRTTAILLEETIDELELKRKAVEAQNHELEIESSLERVRSVAMGMQNPAEMVDVCKIISEQLEFLKVKNIRNVQTAVISESKGTYINYEYYARHDKLLTTEVSYKTHHLQEQFANQMLKGAGEFFSPSLEGQQVKDWYEYQKTTNQFADSYLEGAQTLNYYMFSLGPVALGISTYSPLKEEEINLFKRFRNVFELAYRRFTDIQKAEAQAREAQIEAALERVRAQTMAMHSSEDVGKCVVKMFSELTALGVDEGTRFGIGILNHDNENNQLWTARKNGDEVNMHIGNIDMASHPLLKSARKAWKEQLPLHKYVLEGEDLLNYYQMLNQAPDYKIQIPLEQLPEREIQHCFIFEHGFFYAFSPREFQPDLIHITKRFSSLFEQTYRRYLDLVRAEAQAREAEIELALERVRARTMAMYQTEELKDVIQVIFDQFVGLNIHLDHAGFILDYKEREDMHIWLASHQQGVPTEITFPYFNSPNLNSFRQAKAKQESFFANLLPFEVKNKFYQDLFELIPELTEEAQQAIFSKPALAISTVLLDNVGLYIQHYSETPFTAEENAILMRFGKVFQQTYTRFLDLQKAEAQAREAQIEAALERVRARSMAMHTSQELSEVALELRRQLGKLDQKELETCAIHLYDESPDYFESWAALRSPNSDQEIVQTQARFPKKGIAIIEEMMACYLSNKKDYVLINEGKKFEDFRKMLKQHAPEAYKVVVNSIKGLKPEEITAYWSVADFTGGSLVMTSMTKPNEGTRALLRRFSNVFGSAYTRFLDLQKAEAQAREAQVEVALERVRSRTMAMHKSDELNEVAFDFFNQLHPLGIAKWGFALWLADETNQKFDCWFSTPTDRVLPEPYSVPIKGHPVINKIWTAYENKSAHCNIELANEEKREWDLWLFENSGMKNLPDAVKDSILSHPYVQFSFTSMRYGLLDAIDVNRIPDEQLLILQRFAKVFEQTYTRFLDLQKAEAQAREAQIETALERVRAQTMAMHNSEDVGKCVVKMFSELTALGVDEGTRFGIGILNHDNENIQLWTARKDEEEVKMHIGNLDMSAHPLLKSARKAWKAQVPLHTYVLEGKDLLNYYQMLNTAPDYKIQIAFEKLPEREIHYGFIFDQGFFYAFTPHEFHPDLIHIIQRFSSLFAQTYRRYLDLVKAEGQAREAEIELALERVRARAMAMHNSDELLEVANVMREQFSLLGQELLETVAIHLYPDQGDMFDSWFAARPPGHSGKVLTGKTRFSKTATQVARQMLSLYEGKSDEYTMHMQGELLDEWHAMLFKTVPDFISLMGEDIPKEQYWYCTDFSGGSFVLIPREEPSQESKELLRRSASVFDMAYTRFLDLQKAEAQAREAEIQLGLERLRAKTMAMHRSEDLLSTVSLLFDQFRQLQKGNISEHIDRSALALVNEKEKRFDLWITQEGGTESNQKYRIDFSEQTHGITLYQSFQQKAPYNVIDNIGEKLSRWLDYLKSTGMKISPILYERRRINTSIRFSNGFIIITSEEPLSDQNILLLSRFTKVFEQTYTRFLDLQKAEAQAREAQIETALERVRSRSLAMHKSEELKEVIQVVYEQFSQLNILIEHTGFIIDFKENDDMHIWLADKYASPFQITIPYFDSPHWNSFIEAKQKGEGFFVNQLTFEVKNKFYNDLFKLIPSLPEESKQSIFSQPGLAISTVLLGNVGLYIENFSGTPYTDEENATLIRFGKVFQQAYTRFLDLQKAEAQAREAQIEVALERVRARTMAMHKSEELSEVAALLFEQLKTLGAELWTAGFAICKEDELLVEKWMSSPITGQMFDHLFIPYNADHGEQRMYDTWKNKVELYAYVQDGKELKDIYDHLMTIPSFHANFQKVIDAGRPLPVWQKNHVASYKYGYLLIITEKEFKEEYVFTRFAKVFEQTYTRFLDLQKAEAQAREAQIEAALERVRSRSMAMHQSDELNAVLSTMFTELTHLDFSLARCVIWIFDKLNKSFRWYSANPEAQIETYHVPFYDYKVITDYWEAWEKKIPRMYYDLSGDLKKGMDQYLFNHTELAKMPSEVKEGMMAPEQVHIYNTFNDFGALFVSSVETQDDEILSILERFGNVFNQSYTRFLDIQKAEAQAREAQIEAALERVRSRSMAMHKSDELLDVVNTVFERLRELNLPIDAAAIFVLEQGGYGYWFATADSKYPTGMHLPTRGNQVVDDISNARETQVDFFCKQYSFEDKNQFFHNIFENTDFRNIPDERKKFLLECESLSLSVGLEKNSGIQLNSYTGKVLSPMEGDVLKRFARVFEQAYTRFLDLQKAEAQTREAQIEAALERVRSRSMAMRQSTELNIILAKVFDELRSLELEFERCVIWIYHPENKSVHWWAANPEAESGTDSYLITNQDHPVYLEYWKAWEQRRTKYLYILEGENMVSWCDVLFNEMELGRLPQEVQNAMRQPERVYLYNTFNDFGVLFLACLEPMPDDKFLILERFGKVFDQSYTRFKDIQQAEAREKEAIRQASLDRVRAEIASMRTTTDLERITPLIWKELITLNISFVRCGVFIMDESLQQMHTFLSTPDGKAIAAFHLPYDSPGRTSEILAHWMNKQVYIEHWDETAFSELGDLLVQQGALPSKDVYLKTVPQGGIYLHCLPFMQGMLYVGNSVKLNEDDIQLIQSVADAFATAYARYEDFNKLDAAKQQVDKTLTDLRQTQQQLVQSEKMASLGELTAGIAHEIQNPLNFVNNFSEVSGELVTEMNEELAVGNKQLAVGNVPVAISHWQAAVEISNDLKQNLEKINHHGKRAADIVKGMLQHSRTSSGQKELTDINALCDEYLRLAYHGLRAKDKTFNAKFETDFDTSIPKLNVVSQDIGRVVLNLINNAFYAVSEKQKVESKKPGSDYEPTVTVSTKNLGDKILISVKDNGNGIPDSIKEKIFQPFFTTKPTGQGTGLGLSLSYDIVKAHGGELKVETKENEGTEFTIQVPLS